MTQYKPKLTNESPIIQQTTQPTTNIANKEFYNTTLAIVAIVSLAMIIIYAMRR